MEVLDQNRLQIERLCKANGVKSLYAFGSVITAAFSESSDIDFLVDFETKDPLQYTEQYFNLKFRLEEILHHPIDLLESKALVNSYFIQEVAKTKVLVYAH